MNPDGPSNPAAHLWHRWSPRPGFTVTVSKASLENPWGPNPHCPPEDRIPERGHIHGVVPLADGEAVLCLVGEGSQDAMRAELDELVNRLGRWLAL